MVALMTAPLAKQNFYHQGEVHLCRTQQFPRGLLGNSHGNTETP